MTQLIIWTIAAFGFCWVVADSKISLPARVWLSLRQSRLAVAVLALAECVACLGFWVGLLGQLAGLAPFEHWYIAGFYTCGANLLFAKFIGMLEPEPE